MTKFLVGTDIGTSSTKSVVIDIEGNILASHAKSYSLIQKKNSSEKFPGIKAEHRPEEDYWDAVAETISVSIHNSKISPSEIAGVSVSALSPACIIVDKDLRPLANAHIWMDRRATAECQAIRDELGDEKVFQISGNPIDPYYAATKLLWEKNNRPELYKKTYKMLTAANYGTMKLCGKAVMDYSNASLVGIGFDIKKRAWDYSIFETIGLDADKLPEVYPCDEVIGEVTEEAAIKCGLKAGTPVVAGTVDANAAWVAGGAVADGDISCLMGTAGILGFVHRKPKFTKDMISIVHTADSREMYSTLAATVCCGELIRYFRNNFGHVEECAANMVGESVLEMINKEAALVPPGSLGLLVLPYLGGERTPVWDSLARGLLFGWSLEHGRGHVIRAMMEGAGFAFRDNFERMKESGVNFNYPVIFSEGGANSSLWRQIVCDILNVEGVLMKNSKGAPLGNAVAAGVGVGLFKDYQVVKDWIEVGDRTTPDAERHHFYSDLYQIYKKLYPRLKDLFIEMSHVISG